MAFPVPLTARFRVVWQWSESAGASDEFNCIFHVRDPVGIWTAARLSQIGTLIGNRIGLDATEYASAMTLDRVECEDISQAFGTQVVLEYNVPGGAVGAYSQAVCALVQHTTAGGRPRRGRSFYPGLVEADVAGSSISADRRGEIDGVFGDIRNDISGAGAVYVIVSRFLNKVETNPPTTSAVVASATRVLVGTQRDRRGDAGD